MAGKTKLTPALQEAILKQVEAGASLRQAALACGVSDRTLQNWRNRAKANPRGLYGVFFREADEASARFVSRAAQALRQSLEERRDWRGWLSVLERRDPDAWGARREPAVVVNAGSREETPAESRKRQEFLKELTDEELDWLEIIAIKWQVWERAEGDPDRYRELLASDDDYRRVAENKRMRGRPQV